MISEGERRGRERYALETWKGGETRGDVGGRCAPMCKEERWVEREETKASKDDDDVVDDDVVDDDDDEAEVGSVDVLVVLPRVRIALAVYTS